MEFKVVQKELELKSRGWIPTFHDVSKEVLEIVKESGVKNGTVCIASHHTTCSVMIQEASHDLDSFDLEYLQHDLLDIMRKLVPDFREEGQYRHPGPILKGILPQIPDHRAVSGPQLHAVTVGVAVVGIPSIPTVNAVLIAVPRLDVLRPHLIKIAVMDPLHR